MAARTDKTNTAGQFQKGDPRAKDCQLLSAAKKSDNAPARNRMTAVANENYTDEDRAMWWDMLKAEISHGNLKALELALKIVGEMPDEKMNIGMTLNALTDGDRSLLTKVEKRV